MLQHFIHRADVALGTFSNYEYYERSGCGVTDCPFIGPITGLAISNNNLVTVYDVTAEECMERCRTETTFVCKSIDYKRPEKLCHLQIVNRDDVALSNWPDYDYYEKSCESELLFNL